MPLINSVSRLASTSRRKILATTLMYAASVTVRSTSAAGSDIKIAALSTGNDVTTSVTTSDGVKIFYKDWGPRSAQPIVFHHGWPLSADDWDAQMLYFLGKGFRVIAHDRRGHGRSSQVSDGHDMDHYAADVAALAEHLDLRNAIHVGHSTGGGEATRYVARHGRDRVARLVLIGAVPPLMLKTESNPSGLPLDVFDGLRRQLAANRSQFYLEFASGPFYGYNRPGAEPSQATIWNWWRQGMMGQQQGPLRRHQGLLRDRLHRRPESRHRADAGPARQRRPDRPRCRLGTAVRPPSEAQHPEDLRPAAARRLHDTSRHRQRRPAQVRDGITRTFIAISST